MTKPRKAPAPEWLLDVNLLLALMHTVHVHHAVAHRWFAGLPGRRFATCLITQLAYLRLAGNPKITGDGATPALARSELDALAQRDDHAWWADGPAPLDCTTLASPALVGHRQVTDAWLLALAADRGQVLATLDRGLAGYAASLGLAAHVELVGAAPVVQEPAAPYRAARSRASNPARRSGSPAG